jgi:hypothetical protein
MLKLNRPVRKRKSGSTNSSIKCLGINKHLVCKKIINCADLIHLKCYKVSMHLIFYGFYNDAVSSSDYIASNDIMAENELEMA